MKTLPLALLVLVSGPLASTVHSADPTPPTLPVLVVGKGDVTRFVSLPGSLRADQQVSLHARVSGYVAHLHAEIGDDVKQGQLLAEIAVPELLAERKAQEVAVQVARRQSERLAAAAAASPDLVLPMAVEEAQGRLELAEAAVEKTRTLLEFARITAPFDGVITARGVDLGAHVAPGGGALFHLVDARRVRAVVAVPEAEIPLLKAGLVVQVAPTALPGQVFPASISRLASTLDEASRTLSFEADLDNVAGRLKPGMFVQARVGVETHGDVRRVSTTAIVMEKSNAFVFTVDDGKARKRPVKLGFQDGVNAEILDGVAEGERVLVSGKTPLADGQAVRVQEIP